MLILQDGTGLVASANSYTSVAELESYAAARSISLPDEKEPLLVLAMDYLELLDYKSEPLTTEQTTTFPRKEFGLPYKLKQAQLVLAIEAIDKPLIPTIESNAKGAVTMERVEGAVTVQYAQNKSASNKHQFAMVDKLLAPYLANTGGMGNVRVNRA